MQVSKKELASETPATMSNYVGDYGVAKENEWGKKKKRRKSLLIIDD
jgi:hypothetical protein